MKLTSLYPNCVAHTIINTSISPYKLFYFFTSLVPLWPILVLIFYINKKCGPLTQRDDFKKTKQTLKPKSQGMQKPESGFSVFFSISKSSHTFSISWPPKSTIMFASYHPTCCWKRQSYSSLIQTMILVFNFLSPIYIFILCNTFPSRMPAN